MTYNAWFQCINGCAGQYSLLEVIYRCPACGDLLEVQHDAQALRARAPAAWMQLFDDRCRRNVYPLGSGVWGKKEWVVPFIDDKNIVSMYEGNSNPLPRPPSDRRLQPRPLRRPRARRHGHHRAQDPEHLRPLQHRQRARPPLGHLAPGRVRLSLTRDLEPHPAPEGRRRPHPIEHGQFGGVAPTPLPNSPIPLAAAHETCA
jgi:hypothetical protein